MINTRNRNPFTVLQWQELEHQALIFKYMVAGIPVPPDLLLPIKRGFDSISTSILQHQNGWGCLPMGFGRKADPEPGRCRRTDGKKWRCSKDAFPDSKYCERHMHRGRNRSRKHVELNSPSSTTRPSSSSSSSSLLPTNHHCVSFQALHDSHSSISPLALDTGSYYSSCKGYRYSHALKEDRAEDAFISKGFDNSRSTDEWSLMPLKLGTLDLKRERDGSMFQNDLTHSVKPKDASRQQQHHHCYVSRGFMGDQSESVKEERVHDVQPLRCFFDEWPKDRDSWSDLNGEHHQSSEKSLSTTQLSISIPMTTSDFSLAHT